MQFYIVPEKMTKAIVGQERPGHKYKRRWKGPSGEWLYEYDEPHVVREGGEKYAKLPEDQAKTLLQQMGDYLYGLDDVQELNQMGFNKMDHQAWSWNRDSMDVRELRRRLKKYKRQLSSRFGEEAYHAAGLAEPLEGPKMIWRYHDRFGSLNIRLEGFVKDRSVFNKIMEYHKGLGFFLTKDQQDGQFWYVLRDPSKFDFAKYREQMAEKFPTINLPDEEPPKPAAKPAPVAAAQAPKTVDEVWAGLKNRTVRNAIGAKWDREKKAFAFRFTPGKLSTYLSNSKGSLGSITKWDATTEPWTVWIFDIDSAERALEGMKELEPNFTVVTEGLDEARKQENERQARLRVPIPEVEAAAAPGIALYPYQNEGVRFLVDNDGNAMLGDEMGLGKTPQALAYGVVAKRRMVIINPKNTRRNWVREAGKFFPKYYKPVELDSARLLKVQREYAKEKQAKGESFDPLKALSGDDEREIAKRLGLTEANLASINYESVGKFIPYIKAAGFDTMVVDESHRMKDPSTLVSKTLTKLAQHLPHHILMSGTAIKNKREEFFTQFNLVRPGMFQSKEQLTANRIGDLWDKMRPFYLARQKRFVLKDLPDRTTTITTEDMPEVPTMPDSPKGFLHNAWAMAYADFMEEHADAPESELETWKDEARSHADEAVGEAKEFLQTLEEEDLKELFKVDIGQHAKLTHAAAIAKVPYTVEFAKDIVEGSDSNVLIFTQSKVAAKLIAKQLGPIAVLHHGDLSQEAREAAKDRFDKSRRRADETARVFVSTIQAAKEGINLTAANMVIFNDLPWTAADVAQAEARAHRIGQEKDVSVYWMTAADNKLDQDHADIVKYKYILHRLQNEGKPLTPEEKVWMDEFVKRQDLMRLAKETEKKAEAEKEAAAAGKTAEKPAGGEAEAKPKTKRKKVAKEEEGPKEGEKAPEAPKPEAPAEAEEDQGHWGKMRRQMAAEEKARETRDKTQHEIGATFHRAATAITNPHARQVLQTWHQTGLPVPENVWQLMTALNRSEAEGDPAKDLAKKTIPPAGARKIKDWVQEQERQKNPMVKTMGGYGTVTYAVVSPAGNLYLERSSKSGEWEASYSSFRSNVVDAMPADAQAKITGLETKYDADRKAEEDKYQAVLAQRAEAEAAVEAAIPTPAPKPAPIPVIPVAPKPVPAASAPAVPGGKEIAETQHPVKEKVPAHEHTGKTPAAKEVKLEEKVLAAPAPKGQLSLFKSMDDLYVAQDDFDLCMSWAGRLTEEGDFDRAMELIKGATHKYLRRYPSGKTTPRWYYVYNVTSKHHGGPAQVGEKVKITHEGQTGHYEIKTIHPNGYVTMQHDETGHQLSVKQEHLHEMFAEEHKGAIDAAHARLKQTFEAAKKYGNEGQRQRAREALQQHEERYQIKTPERIAGQKALQLSVLTHAEPSVENHLAAATAHLEAAEKGAPNADLHRQLAEQHTVAAKSRMALKTSAEALKDPEPRFHVPADPDKAEAAPVLTLPPKSRRGGARQPKGAYFGTKEHSYKALKNASDSNVALMDNFAHVDAAYRLWQAGKGPKPPPWEGGDLDHLNQALGLEKPKRVLGKQPKDPRLTSPAEAWDRMVKGAKRWDSATTRHAIQVFQEWFQDHGTPMHMPSEAHESIMAHYQAKADADYAAGMGGEHEAAQIHELTQEAAERDASFDPDKIEAELDTSFDFGFNVEPQAAEGQAAYKSEAPRALRTANTGKPLKYIPRGWVAGLIASTPGYGGGGDGEGCDTYIVAALKRAMTPEGVHVGKFLQEVRKPSGPALDARGEPIEGKATPEALETFLGRLPQSFEAVNQMSKSASVQPHVFVIIPEKFVLIPEPLEKADRGRQVEGHKYIKREGEPGHYVYTYADTRPGAKEGQRAVMMTPLAEEDIGDKARELEAYTREELETAQRRLASYQERLKGAAVPANIDRWSRAVQIALSRKPPKMVATVPAAKPRGEIISRVIEAYNQGPAAMSAHLAAYTPTQLASVVAMAGDLDDATLGGKISEAIYDELTRRDEAKTPPQKEGPTSLYREDEPINFNRGLERGEIKSTVEKMVSYYTLAELETLQERVHEIAAETAEGGRMRPGVANWRTAIDQAVKQKKGAPTPTPAPKPEEPQPQAKPVPPKMVAKVPRTRRNKKKPEQIAIDFNKTAAAAIAENPTAQALEDAEHSSDDPPEPVPEMKAPAEKKKGAEPEGSKLVQTGDHIWGSRKDLADLVKIERAEQLDGMSFDDAAYLVRKKNLVPAHDLSTLRAAGLDPAAAHLSLALLASIQSKPADTDKARRMYVEACHNVVESVLNAKTADQVKALCDELRQKIRFQNETEITRKLMSDYVSESDARAWAYSQMERLKQENPGKSYDIQQLYDVWKLTGYKVVETKEHPHSALGERFALFVARRGENYRKAKSMAYEVEDAEKKNPGAGWELLEKRGQEKVLEKEAQRAAIEARKGKKKTEEDYSTWRTREVPEEVKRSGGRKIKDPDPKRIKQTFNLREVDYGQRGWMSEADREYHTARLEEAFTDFADILGVEPTAVSFNGRLGVALGARGRGKAAAHYETGRNVINITKFNGGGSLAHEWGHALDNIMASVYMGNKEGKGQGVYLSESYKAHNTGIPEDVENAMRAVWNAITDHPDPDAAVKRHYELKKKLRGKVEDLISQNNELVREHDKIQKKPLPEELPKKQATIQHYIDSYTKRYLELTEKGKLRAAEQKEADNLEYWIKRRREDLDKISDPANFRTEADTARMAEIKLQIEDLRPEINAARKNLNTVANLDPRVSHYYSSAKVLGEYWSRTVELFARAFEGYIEDKLGKRGMVSTYLVAGTKRSTWSTGKETAHGPATPYPQGEERDNIYAKMDTLMDVLIKGGHLKKALEWLERIG